MDDKSFVAGSDNIYLDLGYSPGEAAELLAKSQLIGAIRLTIEKRGLTQKQAAKICKTDQPTLSKVFRGQLDLVTIDRLTSWLTLLGHRVEIRVKPYNAKRKIGELVTVV